MGHKCYDRGDFNKIHRSGFSQFKRKPVQKYVNKFNLKNGLKKQSMIPTYQMEESKELSFSDILDQALVLRREQGTLSRLNEIKENSKDILEENVEMGISCSTIIDCEQDKARNNIEVVSEEEDQVQIPVIVEVFQEDINNWRDPLGFLGSSNRFLELYQF